MNPSRRSARHGATAGAAPAPEWREVQIRIGAEGRDLSRSARRQATIALMLATAMQAFDATIANVALPQLERSLGGGIDLGSWVMTSYLCASAVTAIMTGWFRRRWGARPLFTVAIGLFVVASSLCALARSADALIFFRLVQGAAAGIIQPLSQAIVLDLYPKQEHGRMLAIWGATIMAGPMLGPVLGGLITDLASWRWIFAVNAPIGAIAILGLGSVPSRAAPNGSGRIDGIGITLLVIAVGSLQLALQRSIGRMWPPTPETIAEAATAAVAFAAIVVQSRRSRLLLFRFEVFRDINFSVAAAYNFLVGALLFTTIVFVPALSEGPLGWNATQAGLAIAPRGVATMVTMLAMRQVIDHVDHRALLAMGLVITAGALELMSHVSPDGGELWLATTSAAQGVGVGLLFTPLSTLAFSTLGPELRTDAAGVYNLARQLGCAAGVATMTASLQARIMGGLSAANQHGGITGTSPMRGFQTAAFAAYTGCFRTLAIATMAIIPGIFLFRVMLRDKPTTTIH
jgi:MFS transporter, DHA2 family, multidrug resistance protein